MTARGRLNMLQHDLADLIRRTVTYQPGPTDQPQTSFLYYSAFGRPMHFSTHGDVLPQSVYTNEFLVECDQAILRAAGRELERQIAAARKDALAEAKATLSELAEYDLPDVGSVGK